MNEWQILPLDEVAELKGGFAFKSEDYISEGRFILRTLNIKDDGSITQDEGVFLPLEKEVLYDRFLLQEHDTLFVMVGATLGKIGYVRKEVLPALLNQNMWLIRGRDGRCDKRYIHYAFRYVVGKNLHWAAGSARDFVRRDDYRKLLIPSPPLYEQCAIAYILGNLDDKINLNQHLNHTLEALVRALFKEWFIDFGPVRAKMEGRELDGLASKISALFPDLLSSEGSPVGWRISTLDDVAQSHTRSVLPSEVASHTPYIGLEHMPRRSISLSTWEGAGKVTSNKLRFNKGELLFGKLRPYFHKVGIAPVDGICSTDIVVVTPKDPLWASYVLLCLSSDEFVAYANQTSDGTKMPRTNWTVMGKYELSLPDPALVAVFNEYVQPTLEKILANIYENRTLTQLRDLLLPKLISGEIRLKDAERLVADTL